MVYRVSATMVRATSKWIFTRIGEERALRWKHFYLGRAT